MKYILVFMWQTLVFALLFIVAFFICLWEFRTKLLVELWGDYKDRFAHMVWKAFRINCY